MKSNFEYQSIRRYVEGRMSPADASSFEREMQADGFLAEAVEGFQSDPGALNDMPSISTGSSSWMYILGAFAVVAFFVWMPSQFDTPDESNAIVTSEPETNEVPLVESNEANQNEFIAIAEAAKTEILEEETDSELPVLHDFEIEMEEEIEDSPVFIEAYMRPKDAPELSSLEAKKLADNTKVIYVQDLKLVRLPIVAESTRSDEPWKGHTPAAFEDSAPVQSKLQRRLAERVNKEDYYSMLSDALGNFNAEKYSKAGGQFKSLMEKYGENVNHHFYAGLCAYHQDQFEEASAHFHWVDTHVIQSFDQEAKWYYALSIQALGEREVAQSYFESIQEAGGHYAPMATSRLIRMKK